MHGVVEPIQGPAAPAHRGLVLPMVLVLLVVMSFAGLLAARRSATVEEITNNSRVNQVAWLSAQSGLRHCEAVVIDSVESGNRFDAATKNRVQATALQSPTDASAAWNRLANWSDSSPVLITAPMADANASAALQAAPAPRCMAQALQGNRYLITARGLSTGATVNNDGLLLGGAEVWLQSVISPEVPIRSAGGGYE
jgi:type IV pilus assembly protein PilX